MNHLTLTFQGSVIGSSFMPKLQRLREVIKDIKDDKLESRHAKLKAKRMRTREVIARVKKFRDYYGYDIVCPTELQTKLDCLEALQSHKRWLENTLIDAMTGVDKLIRDLGIEWEETK